MTLRLAVDRLATRCASIAGITKSFDFDELPNALGAADLPALAFNLLPTGNQQDSHSLSTLTFDQSLWVATWYLEHVAYWVPVGSGRRADFEPAMVTFIDSYLAKLGGDSKLGSYLMEDLQVISIEMTQMPYRSTSSAVKTATLYECVKFTHRWKAQVTAVA
jgi:hypothetical protein